MTEVMEEYILSGVGKKMRTGYLNGSVSKDKIMSMYNKNKKEADSFSLFGYRQREIYHMLQETHNPLLKIKLQSCLEEKQRLSIMSKSQNEISISKLNVFKENACGIGLRKVIKLLKKKEKSNVYNEKELLLLLLETEFANISAKQYKGKKKDLIYVRKSRLLQKMAEKLQNSGWQYGINDDSGKNACYLVYIYLPNGVQLTWHANDYDLYKTYPLIDAEWDGQVCMTMEKILSYIENKYFSCDAAA